MGCGQLCLASHLHCPDPDCSRASDQREGIVADDFGRPGKLKSNGIVGKRLNGVELIGDAQDYARGVRAIGRQSGVVGQQGKFAVRASACEGL